MPIRKWGSEVTTNSTTLGEQSFPAAASLTSGRFFIGFDDLSSDSGDIRGRLFNFDGAPLTNGVSGDSNDFRINSTTAGVQQYASAAGLSNGRFVVAFEDLSNAPTTGTDIRIRVFDSNGNPVANSVSGAGDDFLANTTTAGTQEKVAVTGLAGGGFVTVWADNSGGGNFNIRARLFDGSGNPQTNGVSGNANDFLINTTLSGGQSFPAVAGLAGGGFVVTYVDSNPASGLDVRARIFAADGTPVSVNGSTSDFVVSSSKDFTQKAPSIVALNNGNFVVAFQDNSGTGGGTYEIKARLFDANGNVVAVNGSTDDILVNTTLVNNQFSPVISAAPDGGFLVTWQDSSLQGADPDGIRGQLFNAAGMKVGVEVLINTTIQGAQIEPAITMLADGRILIAWEDTNAGGTGGDASGYAIRHQIIDPREGIVNGTAKLDTLFGHDLLNDVINGFDGDDRLLGLGGNDKLNGGNGADRMNGDAGNDTLNGEAGNDTLNGGIGNDTFVGGAGNDTMYGGAGDDIYTIADAGDKIVETAGNGENDTVNAQIEYKLAAGVEVEFIMGSHVTGNELRQTITGTKGSDVLKDGGGAGDSLYGAQGNDIYVVYSADTIVVERYSSGGAADRVMAAVDFTLTRNNFIEILTTTNSSGTASIDLYGNSLTQHIAGNAGDNILSSGGGYDTMEGLGGNDTYIVSNFGDIVVEEASEGIDKVVGDYILSDDMHIEVMEGVNITGNKYAQQMTGQRLDGKGGNDTLTGSSNLVANTFIFSTKLGPDNVDTISNFFVPNDLIQLENAVFATFGVTGTLAASEFRINTTGLAQDADDHIIYQSTTGKLFYDLNGSAAGGGVHFATLAAGLDLTNVDFTII